jgi:thiamine-monophosphate kinase
VGARINQTTVPRARIGKPSEAVALDFALHGGDDYELLFTARLRTRVPENIAGVPITEIGKITRNKGILLVREDGELSELLPKGWEHFASSSKARKR